MTTSRKRGDPKHAGARLNQNAGGLENPPWSRVRRVQLIRREVREYLPASTVELLLGGGDYVVEGSAEVAGDGVASGRCYATAMVTIDLADLAEMFREPADAATAQRVAELLAEHPELPDRLAARTRPQLARLAGAEDPHALDISAEVSVRADATTVYIDADVMTSPVGRRRE